MDEEYPIYSLDEVDLSLKDAQEEQGPPLHEQVARKVVFNQQDDHGEDDIEEQEMASESRVVYPSDVQSDVSEVFNQGVARPETPQSSEEIEFTLRTLRNRVTSLEIQNTQLSKQVVSLEEELNSIDDKYEAQMNDMKEKADNERFKHRNDILELTKKHQEEQHAKQALNGKMENIDKLRQQHDQLILDHQKLEIRMEKAASEHTTTKTDLSIAKIELTKLKAELAKAKSECDASKAELNEKNSEVLRMKRDGEQGKGNLDQQVKQLTADKKFLDDQVPPHFCSHSSLKYPFVIILLFSLYDM